jgi:predicted nucleic acid-binding protein
VAFLIDTNVVSEFRKGARANWGVRQFFAAQDNDSLFLPVQVIGEIRAGIEKVAKLGKPDQASAYDIWLDALLIDFGDRIVDFDRESAQMWGTLLSHQGKDAHTIDKQIAAIALITDMTVVTRDKGEAFTSIAHLKVLDPFSDPPDNSHMAPLPE